MPVGRTPILKIGPVFLNLPSTEYPPHWIRTKCLLLFQRGTRTDHSLWLPSRVFCNSSARGPSRQSSGFSWVCSLEKDGLSFYKKQWLVVEVGVIPEFQASIFSELKKVYMCCYNSGIDNFCCSYYSYCKRFFFFSARVAAIEMSFLPRDSWEYHQRFYVTVLCMGTSQVKTS